MLRRMDEAVVRANEILVVGLLVCMALIVFFNVVSRALTGQSFGWGSELARHFLVWMVLACVGLVLRRGGHLALTWAFTTPLGRWMKRLVLSVVLAFAGYAIWAGWSYAMLGRYQISPVAVWRRFIEMEDEFELSAGHRSPVS
jgi:TRAP-type C4-dicarboxylate transport system permease small subunit